MLGKAMLDEFPADAPRWNTSPVDPRPNPTAEELRAIMRRVSEEYWSRPHGPRVEVHGPKTLAFLTSIGYFGGQ